jgi:hypothetical protein
LKKDCTSPKKNWMEYVSDLMFETGFDLIMLGDAKKYLEKWRLENEEKMEARNEKQAQEESQQKERREAHRGDVQNITEILHNQSLASGPKPLFSKERQNPVSGSALPLQTTTQEEQDAWRGLGTSSEKNQKAAETIETVKKKRAYVRKAQKSELQGDSEPNKNKE